MTSAFVKRAFFVTYFGTLLPGLNMLFEKAVGILLHVWHALQKRASAMGAYYVTRVHLQCVRFLLYS